MKRLLLIAGILLCLCGCIEEENKTCTVTVYSSDGKVIEEFKGISWRSERASDGTILFKEDGKYRRVMGTVIVKVD